jgi:7-keto-8-aminopelargonate synthetase-like enzyme
LPLLSRFLSSLPSPPNSADRVKDNTKYFRENLASTGFDILGKEHPISPVLLGDADLSQQFSAKLLDRNIYAYRLLFSSGSARESPNPNPNLGSAYHGAS